jgi:phenylalanine-4-hydroxylase
MAASGGAMGVLPPHLRRFVVDQEWEAYTPRDHAVWRHVLVRLVERLRDRAHESYLHGLEATGIGVDRIPRIDEMNEKLSRFGWLAVAVRGFIPPAVFTALQSRRVLAIAADVRSPEHVEYTPAPDIVHESAGHAPILADPRYAEYLRRCGEVGALAIASTADDAVFHAVRHLSVVKEDPGATPEEVRLAGERLAAAAAGRRFDSEGIRASRLYWWTAEYGLVGSLEAPRLYGAGLLSSLGESLHCLGPSVRREPLTAGCADVGYDITEMQPRLFVTPDFEALFDVLEAFSAGLSFRVGGDHGLAEALRAGSVNHLRLSDGREVTGRVAALVPGDHPAGPGLRTALVRVDGPALLSRGGVAAGRPIPGPVLVATGGDAPLAPGRFVVALPTGLRLEGFSVDGEQVLDLRAWMGGRPLDVAPAAVILVSRSVPSVAGGPADPAAWDRWFGEAEGFAAGDGEARARARKAAAVPPGLAALYARVRELRAGTARDPAEIHRLREAALRFPEEWLLREELEELAPEPLSPGASAPAPS